MDAFINWIGGHQDKIWYCVLMLGIGLPLFQLAGFLIRKGLKKKLTDQAVMLLSKGVVYLGSLIIVLMVLQYAGLKLGTLPAQKAR